MRYAIIVDGIIANIILWDGNTENWQPEEGVDAVLIPEDTDARIGGTYADGVFSPPPNPEPFIPTIESQA